MFLEDGRGLGIVQQTIVQTILWGVVGLRTEINYFARLGTISGRTRETQVISASILIWSNLSLDGIAAIQVR